MTIKWQLNSCGLAVAYFGWFCSFFIFARGTHVQRRCDHCPRTGAWSVWDLWHAVPSLPRLQHFCRLAMGGGLADGASVGHSQACVGWPRSAQSCFVASCRRPQAKASTREWSVRPSCTACATAKWQLCDRLGGCTCSGHDTGYQARAFEDDINASPSLVLRRHRSMPARTSRLQANDFAALVSADETVHGAQELCAGRRGRRRRDVLCRVCARRLCLHVYDRRLCTPMHAHRVRLFAHDC